MNNLYAPVSDPEGGNEAFLIFNILKSNFFFPRKITTR